MQEVAIIGGGASGIYVALFLAQKHPNLKIIIYEERDKVAKRLSATGNGHCNLLNKNLDPKMYKDSDWAKFLFDKYPVNILLKRLSSLGIETLEKGDLFYPLSYSARTYIDYLLLLLDKYRVEIKTNSKLIDYQESKEKRWTLYFASGEKREADKVIFASGGESSTKYGNGNDLLLLFKQKGYQIEEPRPGLTGLKVKGISLLEGVRHEALVTLKVDNKNVFSSIGEVQFKKDGLSGIVIMNSESIYARLGNPQNSFVILDLFPYISQAELFNKLKNAKNVSPHFLYSFFERKLAVFIEQKVGIRDLSLLAKSLKSLPFKIEGTYGFDASQVMIGGIKKNNLLHQSFMSKREQNIFFIGEMLDNDGLCGGYNLSWCLASALLMADTF